MSLLRKHQDFQKAVANQPVFAKPSIPKPSIANYSKIPQEAKSEAAPVNRHTLSLLYSIINHLKAKIDSALEAQLKNNEKIIYNPEELSFEYKPVFDIRTKDDLLEFLIKRAKTGGLAVKDLKDSHIDVTGMIQELKEEAKILTINNKDGSPRIIFYNPMPERIPINSEFKKTWLDLKVPDETALEFEMEKAGLKQMMIEKRKVEVEDSKKKKPKNRKIKITNTHLEGIDLTQDYVPDKK
ncbi:hypothetical protein BB560_001062 [Smittium megazygosporum]|uniref:TFIIE beta domain-containing protein n=1 Tax=Smittium megazygosporum TaxID=133381 RepID=A0A2T9ZIQ0_9FUNG|nr:hypothetical protein BB560_001062 [Smittium megazygosporum]